MNEYKAEVVDPDRSPGNGGTQGSGLSGPIPTGEHETAITAAAQQARAAIEARFVMAATRPRDMDAVRVRILRECNRPRFAEVARYRRPVGKQKNEQTGRWEDAYIEGPSIRLAEAAIRHMGNIDQQTHTIFDSSDKRILRVEVTDLETNATYSKELTVAKTVERKKLKKNQQPIGTRTNSYNQTVYIVPASEGELAAKQDAEISKTIRTLSLRLLPGDILEEAEERCVKTLRDRDAKDPDAARKAVVDAFSGVGVNPSDLREFLGHDIGQCSPHELQNLREFYRAIRDGFTTWGEILAAQRGDADPPDDGGAQESKLDALKRGIQEKAGAAKRDGAAEDGDTQADPEPEKVPAANESKSAKGKTGKSARNAGGVDQGTGEQGSLPGAE